MKRVFFVIPVGLISIAAVGAGLFLRPKNLPSSTSLIKDEIASSSRREVGTPRNDTQNERPEVILLNLDQPEISAEDLKNFEIDSDQDGLTDFVENFYQTDPNNADSDGDGYKDGAEIEKGFNPKGQGTL